ncbi:MAG: TolC family protein [Deltaproteobacteria bacterium]|nr:TolC family protein [Deltaproteobacteria bacterium]
MKHQRFPFVILLSSFLAGCAAQRFNAAWKDYPVNALQYEMNNFDSERIVSNSENLINKGVLTLTAAIALALEKNPSIAAYSQEVLAIESSAIQAGLYINPEIEFTVEDMGGTGEKKGFGSSESTLLISQTIDISGKPSKKSNVKEHERSIAILDYLGLKTEIVSEVKKRFYNLLATQEKRALFLEQYEIAEEVLKAVSEKVVAGRAQQAEEYKAAIELQMNAVRLKQIENDLAFNRMNLAYLWGGEPWESGDASGELEVMPSLPKLSELHEKAVMSSSLLRWKEEIAKWESVKRLESAKKAPEIKLAAGLKTYSATDDVGLIAGISFPIPLFDLNQGGIVEAEKRKKKAESEYKAAQNMIFSEMEEAFWSLSSLFLEIQSLRENILPSARKIFESVLESYKAGKSGYLDLLSAQKTFADIRIRYLDSLAIYHRIFADLERLTAVTGFSKE